MLIRKFKSDPHMKTNLSDSKVVLDPDLIDLTMIPPPMTPDEEGPSRIFPGTASAVSTPPTPFADRQSLEAELQVSQAPSICHFIKSCLHSSPSFQYQSVGSNMWNCPDVTTLGEHSLVLSFSFQPHLIQRKVPSDFSSCISFLPRLYYIVGNGGKQIRPSH